MGEIGISCPLNGRETGTRISFDQRIVAHDQPFQSRNDATGVEPSHTPCAVSVMRSPALESLTHLKFNNNSRKLIHKSSGGSRENSAEVNKLRDLWTFSWVVMILNGHLRCLKTSP